MVPLPDASTPTFIPRTIPAPIRSPGPKSAQIERLHGSLLVGTIRGGAVDGNKSPTPAELTILIAGGVMLIASFLDYTGDANAWAKYGFPLTSLLPIYGVIMAAQVGLTAVLGMKLPARVAGFTWEQIHLVLGLFAGLLALAWLVTDTGKKPIGQWLIIAGGFALAIGAVRMQRERHTGALS
jgi:hypothetical protein